MKKILFLFALVCGLSSFALLGGEPIVLGLTDTVQYPAANCDQTGLRLNVMGGVAESTGLTRGIANLATGVSKGVQLGFVNWSESDVYGVHLGLFQDAKGGDFRGWQGGWISLVRKDLYGVQGGLLAYTKGTVWGVQGGFLSGAGAVKGVQWSCGNSRWAW